MTWMGQRGLGCACGSTHVSRRGFLCTSVAAVAAAPVLVTSPGANAQAQPGPAPAAGRPILIKNGCVLSLDPAVGDFERADVLVSGGKIAAVGPNLAAPDAEVIDASRAIVMPGFIDTHRHMWEGILRNIIPDSSLGDYFKIVQRQLGPHYRPEDVYAANLVSALGAMEAGVTTILDWSHIQNSPEHTDAAIKALADSGIRAVFGYGNPANGLADFRDDPRQKYPEDIRRLRKQYFSSDDQLLTLALASLSNPPDRVADAWAVAREVGAPITIHVGVGNALTGLRAEARREGRAEIRHDLHPLLHPDRHRVQDDRRQWRHLLDRRLRRDDHGTRHTAHTEGAGLGLAPLALDRRRDHGPGRSVHTDAHYSGAPAQRCLDALARGREEPAQDAHRARCDRVRHRSKVRAPITWTARLERSRPARTPT